MLITLLHKNKNDLANKIKQEFKTEVSKNIRLLLEALKKNDPPLIAIANREKKDLYVAMGLFFDRPLGSYQSIFDYKGWEAKDAAIQARLDFILKSISKPI